MDSLNLFRKERKKITILFFYCDAFRIRATLHRARIVGVNRRQPFTLCVACIGINRSQF